MLETNFKHKAVLLKETIENLNCQEGGIYLDCTVGGGGHSSEILQLIGDSGFLYCLDRDKDAILAAEKKLSQVGKNYKLIKSSYVNLSKITPEYNIPKLDGILFDLGVSSYQLDNAERGFSFSKDAFLDMRFDQDDNSNLTAYDVVNKFSKEKLIEIFSKYGEEPYSKTIASGIVEYRKNKTIETTTELSEVILKSLSHKKFKGSVHPATRVFQALRIEVNDELEGLKNALEQAITQLKVGGKLAVISFHSLEDRIVKEIFKESTKNCVCPPRQPICNCNKIAVGKLVNKKPIVAMEQETKDNPRARSAKLRVLEKIEEMV